MAWWKYYYVSLVFLCTATISIFIIFSPVIESVFGKTDLEKCKPQLVFDNRTKSSLWTCKPVRLSPVELPVTALMSYPGSGNTWFRHLLQQATGIATGSVYNDRVLKKGGFPAENIRNGSVLVVKTHGNARKQYDMGLKKLDRVILLIRDPTEAGIAEFHRSRKGHVGTVDLTNHSNDLLDFLQQQLSSWNSTYYTTLLIKQPLHMVWYSDLKTNLQEEMKNVFKFLNVTVSECDIACMLKNQEGSFHRKIKHNQTFHMEYPLWYETKVGYLKELFRKMYYKRCSRA